MNVRIHKTGEDPRAAEVDYLGGRGRPGFIGDYRLDAIAGQEHGSPPEAAGGRVDMCVFKQEIRHDNVNGALSREPHSHSLLMLFEIG